MSAAFEETITDFLKSTPCSKGAREFLIRLRDDNDKHIDRIWQLYTDKGLPDSATNRTIFIRTLQIMWWASERAVLKAARVDWERAEDKWRTAAMELVAKIILEESFSPEYKAEVGNWASEVFKLEPEYRRLGRRRR